MANSVPGLALEPASCPYCGANKPKPLTSGFDYEYGTTDTEFFLVECADCTTTYLNPRPTLESAGIIYPQDYYTLQGRHEKSGSPIVNFFKQLVVQSRIPALPAELKGKPFRILEVGCGDCDLLLAMKRKYPLADCHGLDLQFTNRQREACQQAGITLITSPIENAALGENSYNLVIMNQLIEHTWNPVEVLRKIFRAMADNGRVTISTVNLNGYDRRFFYHHYWGGYYIPRHLVLFTNQTLQAILEKSGFVFEKYRPLVAPVVWTFSFHARLTSSKNSMLKFLGKFMVDRNPLVLGLFTALDLVALLLGLTTSNQQIIARKQGK
jgi:ubiquinone/menaquinone biosynthesis C-methylase UbiE